MKAIKTIVIGLGILILGLMAALGYGLYRTAGDPDFRFFGADDETTSPAMPRTMPALTDPNLSPADGVAFGSLNLGLPAGTDVRTIEATDGRLYVHVRRQDGLEQIIVIDAGKGTVLGTITINR